MNRPVPSKSLSIFTSNPPRRTVLAKLLDLPQGFLADEYGQHLLRD